jgi:hypothetical protein
MNVPMIIVGGISVLFWAIWLLREVNVESVLLTASREWRNSNRKRQSPTYAAGRRFEARSGGGAGSRAPRFS